MGLNEIKKTTGGLPEFFKTNKIAPSLGRAKESVGWPVIAYTSKAIVRVGHS